MLDFRSNETTILEEVRSVALALFREHGLTDWKFRYDHAKRRYGYCNYQDKVISLSEPLTLRDWPVSEEPVRDTLLHEIAHALVGPSHGHDSTWQAKAIEIGCSGNRTHNQPQISGRYKLVCLNGHISTRHRKTGKRVSCGHCSPTFDERYLFIWEDTQS